MSDFKQSRIRLAVVHPNCSYPEQRYPRQLTISKTQRFSPHTQRSLRLSRYLGVLLSCLPEAMGLCPPAVSLVLLLAAALAQGSAAPAAPPAAAPSRAASARALPQAPAPARARRASSSAGAPSPAAANSSAVRGHGSARHCALDVVTDQAWLLHAQLLDTPITVYSRSKEHTRLHYSLTTSSPLCTYPFWSKPNKLVEEVQPKQARCMCSSDRSPCVH